ncbi:MAG TPA: hypothetical protein VLE95_03045, partial [Chlamydiales bacterium]|nr:hypothetical protein [Chlamydiales bacterium]
MRPFSSIGPQGRSRRIDRGSYAATRKWPQNHRFFQAKQFCNCLLSLFVLYAPVQAIRGLMRGDRVFLTLNHFRGATVYLELQQMIEARLKTLQLQKSPIFFLSPFAGFYYLALEIPNPTPFDFPFVTAFGKKGEMEVISQLARGEIQLVIVDKELNSENHLQPTQLCDYV